jgi:hypothetical protein
LHRKYLLKHIIEGKIEMGRRCRRLKHLLADLKDKKRQWNLKEAPEFTL